jgi:uncharacterized protein YfdQ (DUF2303 family)
MELKEYNEHLRMELKADNERIRTELKTEVLQLDTKIERVRKEIADILISLFVMIIIALVFILSKDFSRSSAGHTSLFDIFFFRD